MTPIPRREPWQMWSGALDDAAITEIITACSKIEPQRAWARDGDKKDTHKMRRSIIRWVSEVDGLRPLLWRYAEAANHNAFFVSVMPLGDIQFTEYRGAEGGKYDAHMDVNFFENDRPYDRKLSITVQLSDSADYEGGDFFFTAPPAPDPALLRQKGTVLVFPSYVVHGVTPVTKGIRQSLVCWFEGDRWR